MSSFRRLVLLLGLMPLAACIDGVEPSRERQGFVSLATFDAGGGNYALRASGAFYRQDGLSTGILPADSCLGLVYNPNPGTVASFPTLDAGPRLTTLIGGRRDTLYQNASLGLLVYQLLTVPAIPFVPGDTLTLDIPGSEGGFPGTSMKVRTSEPFTITPVGNPADGQPLTVNWTAAPAPGSLIAFSLRFNNSGTSETPDTQIYCVFADDGTGTIPAGLAAAWGNSQVVSRRTLATRIRQTVVTFDALTKVTLLSYFDVPTQPVPSI